MSLRDRIPVEPLEDERVARIERAVISSLPARPARSTPWRALAPWAVAVAAVAIAVGSWQAASRPGEATVAPVAITASADGARVDLGDAVVVASEGAAFTVTRPGGAVDIHLARGRIELDVASRKDRPPLTVHADDVDVVVVGTRFSVEHDDEVTVAVSEGVVRVRRGGETTTLAAGQDWTGPTRIAVAPEAADPATTAPSATGPGPAAEPTSVDVLRDRVAGGPPPVDPARTGSGSGGRSRPRRDREPVVAEPTDPADDLRTAIKKQPIAAAAEVAGGLDPLTEYQRMAREKGATGGQGLYGMARVQYLAGKNGDALRSLDSYLRRFPSGAETEAVLWLRLRLRCLQHLDDGCRKAAHTYVTRVGGESARIGLAERVTNTK